ncbi:MAG: uroporphyrinogen decarboxylase family protein [Spirochaetaceae bacterium]|jgi:uroporphyrinogen decarboxylase|nr:uroporphyrinogen decarboxylase family protein [Spirochaetaceae bacterium]
MTPREVVRAVVNFEEPDRLPLSISAHSIIRKQQGLTQEQFLLLPPEEQAQSTVDVNRRYGGDILAAGFNGTLAVKALGGKVKFREKGFADVQEPLINNIAELDAIDPERVKKDFHYQSAFEVAKSIVALAGNDYLVSTGSWGPFTQAGLLFGAEPLMRACLRDSEAVRALLDFTFELIKACSEEIIALGIGVGGLADPSSSGDMISRKVFEEFSLPYLRKVYDWYRSRGLITTLHICGDIADRLDLIPETGAQILSLDYKVSMKRAAELLGGKVVIGGNADPVGVIMMGDGETVRKAYLDIFEQVEGVPYVLMAGCGIPGGTPLSNIEVMRDLAYATVPHYRR